MRIVLDTNTVLSGFLWGSYPRQILDLAHNQEFYLYTSVALIKELSDVLSRPKFSDRLEKIIKEKPEDLVKRYLDLVEIVTVSVVERVVINDPDDDQVLACAISASANYIISGDKDLLSLGIYREIPIIKAAKFIEMNKLIY